MHNLHYPKPGMGILINLRVLLLCWATTTTLHGQVDASEIIATPLPPTSSTGESRETIRSYNAWNSGVSTPRGR